MAESPQWEKIQIKTFTKWVNNHLNKEYGGKYVINNILEDWDTGLNLMYLSVALYKENEKNPEQAITMPKLRANEMEPKARIQKVNNANKAIELLKKAGVGVRGVSAENLVDHEKIQILGMIWIIILDYAARGFGGTAAEVKRALLEWVNKKTEGYDKVNPPGVKNFTKDWKSGLAWCALIHRHRPELLNYDDCLDKSNAENLELAFSLAEEHVGIPRLLDVEDVDTDSPDEKSIMTYVMEYFHAFAGDALREQAAKQAAEWLKFMRDLWERKNDYERRARALLAWVNETTGAWSGYSFGDDLNSAKEAFNGLRNWVLSEYPNNAAEKMDIEALLAEIQTTLKVNNLAPYAPPDDITSEAIDGVFDGLDKAQAAHGHAVRQNRNRFIEKKDDSTAAEMENTIKESFEHYDENKNGSLNKTEFMAACMEMGIVLKTEAEKDALFNEIAKGDDTISFEEYHEWMEKRLVVRLDDPAGVKAAFRSIANGATTLSANAMNTPPLTAEDIEFLKQNMAQADDGNYDYDGFVDKMMA